MALICSEVGCNAPIYDCGIRAGGGDLPVLPTEDCNLQLCEKHHIPHHLCSAADYIREYGAPPVTPRRTESHFDKDLRCVLLFSLCSCSALFDCWVGRGAWCVACFAQAKGTAGMCVSRLYEANLLQLWGRRLLRAFVRGPPLLPAAPGWH